MKKLLLILLVSCSFLSSQGLSDEDMVKLAAALKQQKELIAAYEVQVTNYEEKVVADSVVISNQDSLIKDLELILDIKTDSIIYKFFRAMFIF